MSASCELCGTEGGMLLVRRARWRVVRVVDDEAFPAFYRVIWNTHCAEFSELCAAERAECMEAVAAVERALREIVQPLKVNLASLGNAVPHLHWHVVARFEWDSRFPKPIWAEPVREVRPSPRERLGALLALLDEAVMAQLALLE